MQIGRLGAWVASVLTCSEQTEKCGRHKQKLYADTFQSHVREALNQVIGQVRGFV